MTVQPDQVDARRLAGWLPADQEDLESWIEGFGDRADGKGEHVALHPVIANFQRLVDSDPILRMYVSQMIAQVPSSKPYQKRHVRSFDQLLRLMNELLRTAPEFSETAMVATPMNAIFDWMMGTPAGFAAFRDPRINAMLKEILTVWCGFLSSADSLFVLNDSPTGWKSAEAQRAVGMHQYRHDPQDGHWGFASWNAFFTRHFKDGERPSPRRMTTRPTPRGGMRRSRRTRSPICRTSRLGRSSSSRPTIPTSGSWRSCLLACRRCPLA